MYIGILKLSFRKIIGKNEKIKMHRWAMDILHRLIWREDFHNSSS
jgi:hypothetical protein